jgi:hypothetical protein
MLALETLKNTLKPLKTQNIYITTRVRAWRHQPRPLRLAPANPRLAPSPGHTSQAYCLLLAEPSPGHTSFLQQHHFQGNIQQFKIPLYIL